jgi:hypothetical protein
MMAESSPHPYQVSVNFVPFLQCLLNTFMSTFTCLCYNELQLLSAVPKH